MKPWDARDKALLLVSHTTRIRYSDPVVEAHSEVRKTPVDTPLQRVLMHKLEVSPDASVRTHVDYFGNCVHHFNRLEPHDELVIRAQAVVETTDAVCGGPQPSEDTRPWRQLLAEFLHPSPAVPALAAWEEIQHRVMAESEPHFFVEALLELAAAIRARFRWDPAALDVHANAAAFFEAGAGDARAFAHAMLGVLRLAGVPCRFASGYVDDAYGAESDPAASGSADAVRGFGASHAWVQAWHPELGWVGADPSNGRLVDWQYVRVAIGRDYSDVRPLRSAFVGFSQESVEVEVDVARIG